jgi:hypothetical protein
MHAPTISSLAALGAIAVLAAPGVATAKHGADDPPGHVRHSAGEVHHCKKSKARHHARRGCDDARRHGRHGADDGPNHH